MAAHSPGVVRAVALAGPTGAGKTSLMEALLVASGAKAARAGGGPTVGDSSPEARARGHSVELNFATFDYMGDSYALIDCPGAVDCVAEGDFALPAVDLAIVVAPPDSAKAILLQPTLQELERLGTPHLIFVNRADQAHEPLSQLLEAFGAVSARPVVARQLPTREGEQVTGYIDLALERAFAYRDGDPQTSFEAQADEEKDARFHMLEQLADHDDQLLEQLLSDETPEPELVFGDIVRELNEGLIVPVLLGDSIKGYGVGRLLKALRHDAAAPQTCASRLGVEGKGAYVIKTAYAGQAGKLAYARVLGGTLADGSDLVLPNGDHARAGGLFSPQGAQLTKIAQARPGEVVAIGKVEGARAGQFVALGGASQTVALEPPPRPPLYGLAISAKVRNDDVRLSTALAKLVEEDPALTVVQDSDTHQMVLNGQSEGHLRLALERMKRRFGVEVDTQPPATPYKETISSGVTQHARHKKQTGGHGQFGDVTVEIKPLARGEGFAFSQRITGGVVPRQWIPAVEQGVRDAMAKGPLGFPVTDVSVCLIDGSYHSVDSSEMAFRQAGRLAMDEGLRRCGPTLLEPIERVAIHVPTSCTSGVTSMLSSKRGQVLGFGPRDGWRGWDTIEAYLPRAERGALIGELRSLSQGLGAFEFRFDHMTELVGKLADDVVHRAGRAVAAA
jgi:elongation factor G